MHTLFVHWIRLGFCLLICAVMAGCAVDLGTYPPAQSMEAAVQTVLAKQGYYQGPIDGSVGPATSRAIRNYQRDHQLTPTGTINPALTASMGLGGQANAGIAPGYYAGYAGCSPWYAAPTYWAPPAVIGLGWGGGWGGWGGGCWNRGWGGGYGGWNRGWGGGYGGWNRGWGYGRGWCR
ncbi:MAG: peptidoglycan-binding protein [Verrucomicrobia bacterium]|nr:peptidoglycan-binding protein [Verrucomicrobiota bacterium]